MIPHSRPALGPEEEAAVRRVIQSGHLAQGPETGAFESELAAFLGVNHVVAVSSGSAALHLSLLALGLGRDDGIALPTCVCAALLHAVQHVNGRPVLLDSAPGSLNASPDGLGRGQNPRAVILPHMFGTAAHIEAFLGLNIPIIEDCATSLGAYDRDRPLGARGRLSVFSFYATKVLCAGEGGAVATDDEALAGTVRDLRDYDGRADATPRFNYKLTDLQAALARVQLRKLGAFIRTRQDLGRRYTRELSPTAATLPCFGPGEYPFRYIIRHPAGADALIPRFEHSGIAARRPVFRPLHRLLDLPDRDFPIASDAHSQCISLPLYPALTPSEIDQILQTAREIL